MLDIDIDFRCDILFVRLFGKLTKDNSSKLYRKIINLLNDRGIIDIVINIQNLSYIDYYGMKTIRKCYKMSGRCVLCVNPRWLNKIDDFKFVTDEKDVINKINI